MICSASGSSRTTARGELQPPPGAARIKHGPERAAPGTSHLRNMTRRLIDISCSLRTDIMSDPPGFLPQIAYFSHKDTVGQVAAFFPGLRPSDLPDSEGW